MRIFISYGHDQNAELVMLIKQRLETEFHVWIDQSQLKAGDDWRRSITDGLLSSDRVLACLSAHAVRDPGVCREEIAIALGVRHGILTTILVEKLQDHEIPLSLGHIQRFDMSDWREIKARGEAEFNQWLKEKTTEIKDLVTVNRTYAQEMETLAQWLHPQDQGPLIGSLLQHGFVGREWLRDRVEDWRKGARHHRVMCIAAEPGFGKSSFMAWLAHTHQTPIAAIHFCRFNQPASLQFHQIIRNLAFQLATRFPDYRMFLMRGIETILENCPNRHSSDLAISLFEDQDNRLSTEDFVKLTEVLNRDPLLNLEPSELFQKLIAGPAHYGIDGGRERYLILVDALDEADETLIQSLASMKDMLPSWLGMLLTCRPQDAKVAPYLALLNPVLITCDNEHNRADASIWIENWLNGEAPPLQPSPDLSRELLQRSNGNFQYLGMLRTMLDTHTGNKGSELKETLACPAGLGSLYFLNFQRQLGKDSQATERYHRHQRPLLRLLIASRQALPLRTALLALGNTPAASEQFMRKSVAPLGSLFPRIRLNGEDCITPFHKSITEWLADAERAGQYHCAPLQGHLDLYRNYWRELLLTEPRDAAQRGHIHDIAYHGLEIYKSTADHHISELQLTAEDWNRAKGAIHAILIFLRNSFQNGRLLEWLEWRAVINCHLLGAAAAATIRSKIELAIALIKSGQQERASSIANDLQEITKKQNGECDSLTLATDSLIALILKNQGFLQSASEVYEELARNSVNLLGADHPSTQVRLHNFAINLIELGKHERACSILEELIDSLEENKQGQSELYATALLSFSRALHNTHFYEKASFYRNLAYEKTKEIFGEMHLKTLQLIHINAIEESELGHHKEAKEQLKYVSTSMIEVAGEEHPSTLLAANNLAYALQACGELDEAECLLRKTIEIRSRVYGTDHPETMTLNQNLARNLTYQSRFQEALSILTNVLQYRLRRYGRNHYRTINTRLWITIATRELGDLDTALASQRELVEDATDALGADHHRTLLSVKELAVTLHRCEDMAAAGHLFERTLARQSVTLGEDHTDTLQTRHGLALLQADQGMVEQAIATLRHVIERRREKLGANHPDTRQASEHLDALISNQKQ